MLGYRKQSAENMERDSLKMERDSLKKDERKTGKRIRKITENRENGWEKGIEK